jgi:hypothetical protein
MSQTIDTFRCTTAFMIPVVRQSSRWEECKKISIVSGVHNIVSGVLLWRFYKPEGSVGGVANYWVVVDEKGEMLAFNKREKMGVNIGRCVSWVNLMEGVDHRFSPVVSLQDAEKEQSRIEQTKSSSVGDAEQELPSRKNDTLAKKEGCVYPDPFSGLDAIK